MARHDDIVYLRHILDAIARIQQYIHGIDEDSFLQNPLIQDGVIRQEQIIGEASRRLYWISETAISQSVARCCRDAQQARS